MQDRFYYIFWAFCFFLFFGGWKFEYKRWLNLINNIEVSRYFIKTFIKWTVLNIIIFLFAYLKFSWNYNMIFLEILIVSQSDAKYCFFFYTI